MKVDEIRKLHVRVVPMFKRLNDYCRCCGGEWPCDTAIALAALDRAQAQLALADAMLDWWFAGASKGLEDAVRAYSQSRWEPSDGTH